MTWWRSLFHKRHLFEPGASLAYLFDVDGGYREAVERRWRVVPLRHGLRGALAVKELLADGTSAPAVVLEPTGEEGRLRVTSTAVMAVQGFGDRAPRVAGRSVEVGYGTVLRAGPLLFTPLYREQARALEVGALALPLVGEPMTCQLDQEEVKEPPIPGALWHRWRLVVANSLLAIILLSTLWTLEAPLSEPRRVLVVLHGWDEQDAQALKLRVMQRFAGVGLEPGFLVTQGPRRQVGVSEYAQTARRYRASAVVIFQGTILDRRSGQRFGSVAQLEEISARWKAIGSNESGLKVVTIARDADRDEVRRRIAGEGLTALLSAALGGVLELDEVARGVLATPSGSDDEALGRLRLALGRSAERREALSRYGDGCSPARGGWALAPSPAGLRSLTPRCQSESAVGLVRDETAALVVVRTAEVYFDLERPREPGSIEGHHRLELVPLSGAARETITWAPEIIGRPSLSADGRLVTFVERASMSQEALVQVEIATGRRQVLAASIEPRDEGISLASSARGERVARVHHQLGRCGDDTLAIVDQRGAQVWVSMGSISALSWVELSWPGYASPRELLVLTLGEGRWRDQGERGCASSQAAEQDRPEGAHLAIVDPADGQVIARVFGGERELTGFSGAHDGALIFSYRGADESPSCGLGVHDPLRGETTFQPVQRCATVVGGLLTPEGTVLEHVLADGGGPAGLIELDPTTGEARRRLTVGGDDSVHLVALGRRRPVALLGADRPHAEGWLVADHRAAFVVDLSASR